MAEKFTFINYTKDYRSRWGVTTLDFHMLFNQVNFAAFVDENNDATYQDIVMRFYYEAFAQLLSLLESSENIRPFDQVSLSNI